MGTIHKGSSASHGPVRSAVITIVGNEDQGFAVTAAVTQAGQLQIALWNVARNGRTIGLEKSRAEGDITEVAVTNLPGHTITAAIRSDGYLEVTSWGLDLTSRGSARGARGSHVYVDKVIPSGGVVTAMRDSEGRLRLDLWKIPLDGTVTHVSHTLGAHIDRAKFIPSTVSANGENIDVIARLPSGHLQTQACLVTDGRLKLSPNTQLLGTASRFDSLGSVFEPGIVALEDEHGKLQILAASGFGAGGLKPVASAGQISRVAMDSMSFPAVVTAVRDHDGNLKLSTWVPVSGQVVLDADLVTADPVKDVDVTCFNSEVVVTAAQTSKDELRLTTWKIDPLP